MSLLAGSNANASAGNVSVTRLIHKIWIGNNTCIIEISYIPNTLPIVGANNVANNNTITSPTLHESKNWITFKILS